MKQAKLLELIEKYLQGKTNREEIRILKDWYEAYEEQGGYTDLLNEEEKDALRQSMLKEVQLRTGMDEERSVQTGSLHKIWPYTAVASMLILLISLGYFQWLYHPIVQYETAYGEVKTIVLPDQSVVTLNGNSKLRLKDNWEEEENREVWLEGEAYFSVTHLADDQKFLVHTPEDLCVEVLGTEFNITQRKSGTSVALRSGSVKLHIPRPLAHEREIDEVMMEPGEIVKLDPQSREYTKNRETDLEKYYGWKQKKLVLDHTSLKEVLHTLENTYGITIRVEDDTLYWRSASGSMPLPEEKSQLLTNIALLYDLTYEEEIDHILLKVK